MEQWLAIELPSASPLILGEKNVYAHSPTDRHDEKTPGLQIARMTRIRCPFVFITTREQHQSCSVNPASFNTAPRALGLETFPTQKYHHSCWNPWSRSPVLSWKLLVVVLAIPVANNSTKETNYKFKKTHCIILIPEQLERSLFQDSGNIYLSANLR